MAPARYSDISARAHTHKHTHPPTPTPTPHPHTHSIHTLYSQVYSHMVCFFGSTNLAVTQSLRDKPPISCGLITELVLNYRLIEAHSQDPDRPRQTWHHGGPCRRIPGGTGSPRTLQKTPTRSSSSAQHTTYHWPGQFTQCTAVCCQFTQDGDVFVNLTHV